MSTFDKIELTESEALLRRCLLDCRDHELPDHKLEIRFTGGWVRDKLLNIPSDDIDVALSTMTGKQFCETLYSYMKTNGPTYQEAAQKAGVDSNLHDLHEIAARPEQSKHLETITTKIFGYHVDFVNLRKETYTEDSRNPQMEFGTAAEDALRRDATVNALFYHLDTESVEDFTGQGLRDLEKKTIRTPLAPYETFKDDPLRVLRLIRFASRLGYEIDADSQEAMKDKTIHEALRAKISRERIGTEVGKMLKGPDPFRALMFMHDLGLYNTVFADPQETDYPDSSGSPDVYRGLQRLMETCPQTRLDLDLAKDQELDWFLAAFTPWNEQPKKAELAAKKGVDMHKNGKILVESIKKQDQVHDLLHLTQDTASSRSRIGMCIYRLGPAWRSHVLYALLCELQAGGFESVAQQYQSALEVIREKELTSAANIKPILDGNKLKELLEIEKGGPWLVKALDVVREWQFDNPQGMREQASEAIKQRRGELGMG